MKRATKLRAIYWLRCGSKIFTIAGKNLAAGQLLLFKTIFCHFHIDHIALLHTYHPKVSSLFFQLQNFLYQFPLCYAVCIGNRMHRIKPTPLQENLNFMLHTMQTTDTKYMVCATKVQAIVTRKKSLSPCHHVSSNPTCPTFNSPNWQVQVTNKSSWNHRDSCAVRHGLCFL